VVIVYEINWEFLGQLYATSDGRRENNEEGEARLYEILQSARSLFGTAYGDDHAYSPRPSVACSDRGFERKAGTGESMDMEGE
jgi:hypothetical protein